MDSGEKLKCQCINCIHIGEINEYRQGGNNTGFCNKVHQIVWGIHYNKHCFEKSIEVKDEDIEWIYEKL